MVADPLPGAPGVAGRPAPVDTGLPSAPRWWARPGAEVLADLRVRADGLSETEAARRLAVGGPNELSADRSEGVLRLVLAQLRDTFVLVLLGAAALTVVVRDYQDTVVILLVITVNSALGVSQQRRAERAVAALAQLSAPAAHVVRDGAVRALPAPELVPGDVVRLEAGDVVPADARLLEASALQVDEAVLTGESLPAAKDTGPDVAGRDVPVADRHGAVHAGTVVTAGRGVAVVAATGMSTEVGRIAGLMQGRPASRTPLEGRLAVLARQIAAGVTVLCLLVLVLGLLRGIPTEQMLLIAVSLAVAAVPESLPAVVALSLAMAARRMAARRAVVRSLPAVEALGSVTVLASDKTGTLTEGVMTVRRLWTPHGELPVLGSGYGPEPTFVPDAPQAELLQAAVLCNDARLVPPAGSGGTWGLVGDPTEGALLAAGARAGLTRQEADRRWPRIADEPFDPARARMTTVHQAAPGELLVVCKGAPEVLLGVPGLLAPGPGLDRASDAALALADQGLRVLAVASGRRRTVPDRAVDAERDLRLLGLVGLQDPPRAGAAASVARCRAAGIVPLLITGDHPGTAAALARTVGILEPGQRVVTGADLRQVLADGPEQVRVYARTAPEQKLDIVDAWRGMGHVVAMTGDGVNDAPALRHADVGVAMGRTGTEVARQAADVVLADDDISTIVTAVGEGRRVYDNIRRFLLYGLSGGAAEVLVMLLGPFLGLALPLLPAQILWINLLTHGLPGVALGAEQAEPSVLNRPPRPPQQQVLGDRLASRIAGLAVLVAGVSLAVGVLASDARPWQTMLLVALTTQQLLLAMALRSDTRPGWQLRGNPLLYAAVALDAVLLLLAVYAPPLQALLSTDPLTAGELLAAVAASLLAPLAVEAGKARRRRRAGVR